ncbi:MAG: hypothetical protein E7027_05540 [Elusimicrobium sp.]|uniref:O-antigen ligase-related domain-containing protein n=1 Tax=Candidatus Avelusimicrobium gallicola TaxID=2562704 RepID=A0A928HGB8_9BACT|nr:hypothetical protein [Elusimicrobium sp.]
MSAKRMKKTAVSVGGKTENSFSCFLHKAIVHLLGWTGLLVSVSFFTATYDTAQVKLTLFQVGAFLLLGCWGTLILTQHKNPFTRRNLPFILPVMVYLGWNILSFLFAPYKLEAAEEFSRILLYGAVTLLAATELTLRDVRTLFKFILAAAWISFSYAGLQIIDGFFPGADPMPWRGFFTKRVFSTHANPNFFGDFVIFASAITGAVYLFTKKKSLLVLFALGAAGLFFTESKGAWVAYAAMVAGGIMLYANRLSAKAKKQIKKVNILAAVLLFCTVILAGFYTAKRFQSVSFRAHTWLGAFEMVKDSPVLGTGPGSFKVIYPDYRRPQIYYIESSHNTETQHAENELLEQAATTGLAGLAIFLWFILSTLLIAVKRLNATPKTEEEKERNFYLLGLICAAWGMFVHSWVDISLRFASSGFFFALFLGILLALSKPQEEISPLPENQPSPRAVLVILRLLLTGAVAYCAYRTITLFYMITRSLGITNLGEFILISVSWGVLLGICAGAGYVLLRLAWTGKNAWATGVLLLTLLPITLCYNFFQANHYYSLGLSLVMRQNAEGSLGFFTKAIDLNPLQTEYRQYRANTLATTFQLNKFFSPARGDKKLPANDYERALRDFQTVEKHAPNHPLLHQSKGQLFYAMALHKAQAASQAATAQEHFLLRNEATQTMEKAKESFKRSLTTDPVNADTYAFLTSIALMERNPREALEWISRYRQGPDGVIEEEFLQKNRQNPRFFALEREALNLLSLDETK